MKSFLAVLAAIPLLLGAEAPKITVNKPWTGSLEKGFEIKYTGKGHPRIVSLWPVKKNTFYAVRAELTSSVPAALSCRIMPDQRKGVFKFQSGDKTNFIHIPVYTGNQEKLSVNFFKSPSDPVNVSLKNFSVKEMTPEELAGDQFRGMGTFETTAPVYSSKQKWEIVPSERFAAGEKALELNSGNSVMLTHLAVIPGKRYQLRFFACAESKGVVNASVQMWSPYGHKGKHFYKSGQFSLNTQPKECLVEVTIPEVSECPDSADRIASASIRVSPKGSKVWLDEVTFREVK